MCVLKYLPGSVQPQFTEATNGRFICCCDGPFCLCGRCRHTWAELRRGRSQGSFRQTIRHARACRRDRYGQSVLGHLRHSRYRNGVRHFPVARRERQACGCCVSHLVWAAAHCDGAIRRHCSTSPPKTTLFRAAFLQGVATNIANPKSIAFYAAVFSSAAPAHVSTPTFFAMLATVGATATCWYGAVALVLSHAAIAMAYRRAKAWIDRACGGIIIVLGIRQAFR